MNAIPRVALVWLLVAQVLVILPHLAYMPLWIAAMWLGCAAWRVQVFRMRAGYPRAWVKLALALLAGAGVWLSRGSLVGLDAGAVLLIAAFILKLVEMKTRRDALVLVFLGFFAVVVGYLFDDGFLAALYSLLPVTALLAALIGLQQSAFASRPWPTLRLAGGLLLQALPLMLLLFLFFPRLGPLWSLPMPGNKGVTGLSESMAPGDIAELGRSAELAFRVRFEGAPPPREQLYWRALTMERFDGRRWAQAPQWSGEDALHWQKRGPELRYDVIMQPSSQPWLFALDVAQTDQTDTRLMSDFHLQRRQPVEQRLFYRVSSWPQALRESSIDPRTRWRNLQLPMHGNPRARALADELRQAHAQPQALVAALLQRFNHEPFAYTLKPPATGADGVDDFLFDTRSGFCAHYAGAMAFVLRAAGIPARVVAGYQGGELNPAGNYLLVHQFDAHAWVEYWQPEQGWLSVDPTYQVAPERIEQGLEQALAGDSEYLADAPLSPLRYRGLPWLNDMRLAWDSLNYGWQRWSWPTRVSSRAPSCSAGSAGSIRPDWACCSVPRRYCRSVCSRCSCSSPGKAVAICAAANCAASNACWRCMACAVPPAKGYAPTASAPPASCRRRRQPSRPSSARSKRNAMDTAVPMIQGCVCAHCAGRCPGAWCARPRGMAGERRRHDGVHR